MGEWNAKPLNVKTWDNFKSHFRDAQVELKEIQGPIMLQAGYHHANMLAEQLQVDLNNQQTQMLAMVQGLARVEDDLLELIKQPSANAAINDVHQQMLELL